MLWKQVPGFSPPWHPSGRPWEMSVLYRWGNATRQVKPLRSHTGSVWQGWEPNHSSFWVQPPTSPFSPSFLMQNTWRWELQSSSTHTLIQMSLHWCINKIILCKYMGKPLHLPFHSYITVADTFLSGGRMSIHTRTYEGPRGKQAGKMQAHRTTWRSNMLASGLSSLWLLHTDLAGTTVKNLSTYCKVPQPTAKYPSLLKSTPACWKVPQPAGKYPSLLESTLVCCWTSDSSDRSGTNGTLPVIPPEWQIQLLENGKEVDVLSPKTSIYLWTILVGSLTSRLRTFSGVIRGPICKKDVY